MKTIYRQSALTERVELKGESETTTSLTQATPVRDYALEVLPTVDPSEDPEIGSYLDEVAGQTAPDPDVTLDTPLTDVFGDGTTDTVPEITDDTNNATFEQPVILQTSPFIRGLLVDVERALVEAYPTIAEVALFFETLPGQHPILDTPQNNFQNPILSGLQESVRTAFNSTYATQLQTLQEGGATSSRLFDDFLAKEADLVMRAAGKKGIARPTAEDKTEDSPYPVIFLDPINYEIANPETLHEYAQTISGNTLLDKVAVIRLSNFEHFEGMANAAEATIIMEQLPTNFMQDYIQDAGYLLQKSMDVLTVIKKFNALPATDREIGSRVDGGAWDRIIGAEEKVYQKMRITNFKLSQAKQQTEYSGTFFDKSLREFTAFIDVTLAINQTLMDVSQANRDETALLLGTSGYETQNYINVEYLFPRGDLDPAF